MIVGVDVSSRAIHLAWLEDGRPQRWHQELAKGHLIDRLRSIKVTWPDKPQGNTPDWLYAPWEDVTDVAIEMPFGQSRTSIGALMAVVGIVTKQAPSWARVAWPSSGELRAAIGAKNTKTSAHFQLCRLVQLDYSWDEHELDALVACIGWTRILNQQDAA